MATARRESDRNDNTRWKWLLLFSFLALLPLAVISLLMNNVDEVLTQESSVSQLAQHPNSYYGRSIIVRGEVDKSNGNRAFILDEEGTSLGDEVLVLSRLPLEPQGGGPIDDTFLSDGLDVRVIGQVRRMTFSEAERELGIELDPRLEQEFQDKPVIVADLVEPLPE